MGDQDLRARRWELESEVNKIRPLRVWLSTGALSAVGAVVLTVYGLRRLSAGQAYTDADNRPSYIGFFIGAAVLTFIVIAVSRGVVSAVELAEIRRNDRDMLTLTGWLSLVSSNVRLALFGPEEHPHERMGGSMFFLPIPEPISLTITALKLAFNASMASYAKISEAKDKRRVKDASLYIEAFGELTQLERALCDREQHKGEPEHRRVIRNQLAITRIAADTVRSRQPT
jgi:hypothetical protein